MDRISFNPFSNTSKLNSALWPAFNTAKSGNTTWRCKSCHGWDYVGAAGAYGIPGNDYDTGIIGIVPVAGGQPTLTTPEEIYNFLHDGMVNNIPHGLGTLIADDAAFYALTKFVVMMREEAAQARAPANFINLSTKLTVGSEANGAAMYAMATDGGCVTCHGEQGKLLDFADGDPATIPNQFVDTYARSNPWETLHKIRFGQPGSTPYMAGLEDIPALAGQDIIQTSIDVVAFSQNGLVPSSTVFDFRMYQGDTPAKAGIDFARGGALYDKWWTGANETEPLVTPPDIVGVDHALTARA